MVVGVSRAQRNAVEVLALSIEAATRAALQTRDRQKLFLGGPGSAVDRSRALSYTAQISLLPRARSRCAASGTHTRRYGQPSVGRRTR